MKIEELKYTLEGKNIASEPREVRLGRRDLARLLVVDRQNKTQQHSFVQSLPDLLNAGDTIILNDSKRVPGIIKANLIGNSAQVEIQLVEIDEKETALCRIYPTHHLQDGAIVAVGDHLLTISGHRKGSYQLYQIESSKMPIVDILKELGYPITSFFYSNYWDIDFLNPYFANKEGSIESPLAGLHFTPELIGKLQTKGIHIGYVTLHSVGSWLPFLEEHIEEHKVMEERCHLPEETADLINRTKATGGKVIPCGSTAMRTIETAAIGPGEVQAYSGKTSLYIQPGYSFKIADHYFTNFHPYRTSLMVLDAAFCGSDLLLESYELAKNEGYLFFEFGDAIIYI